MKPRVVISRNHQCHLELPGGAADASGGHSSCIVSRDVAVRITSHQEEHRFVVCVHGTLDQSVSALLRAELEQASAGSVVVDLSGLVTFDEAGLALLRALVAGGTRLEGASPYVKLRLAPDTPAAMRRAPPH